MCLLVPQPPADLPVHLALCPARTQHLRALTSFLGSEASGDGPAQAGSCLAALAGGLARSREAVPETQQWGLLQALLKLKLLLLDTLKRALEHVLERKRGVFLFWWSEVVEFWGALRRGLGSVGLRCMGLAVDRSGP